MTQEQEIYFARCFMEAMKLAAGENALAGLHPSLIDADLKRITVEAGNKAGLAYATAVSHRQAAKDDPETFHRTFTFQGHQVVCTCKSGAWTSAIGEQKFEATDWPEMKTRLRQYLSSGENTNV